MKRLVILFLLVMLSMLIWTPIVRAIAPPDSMQIYSNIHVYRHILELGDVIVVAKYNIDYDVPPTSESADEAFLFRLFDGNGTDLGSNILYPFHANGYGVGIITLYFSSDEAPTWDQTHILRLEGNPGLSWSPGSRPLINNGDFSWHTTSTLSATETLLTSRILTYAQELETEWIVDMIVATPSGNKLTSTGESYFTTIFPDLREVCPNLFEAAIYSPIYEEEEYDQAYIGYLASYWDTTEYQAAFETLGDYIGISESFLKAFFWMGIMMLTAIGITYATHTPKPALLLMVPMIMAGNLIGMLSFVFTAMLTFVCILLMGYIFFYRSTV